MFESNTEDAIWERILKDIPNDLDIRAGSILHTSLSPAVNEIARLYNDLDRFLEYTFASENMPEHLLDLRVGEMGITRNQATKCIKKAEFKDNDGNLIDIALNSRFYIDNFYFEVLEKISTGIYQIQAEISGIASNNVIGNLIPVDYIEGLATAEIIETLIPAENTENNTSLYKRYLERLNEKPFSGNISAYKEFTKAIEGVADVKVLPVWAGGGTVKLILIDNDYNSPTQELINKVQTEIDPVQNQGQGIGIAPIGHVVTVESVESFDISIEAKIILKNGVTVGQVQEDVTKTINNYFKELKESWATEEFLVIRTSQIEARLLNIEGILDCESTTINNKQENLNLRFNEIPSLNEVVLSV